MKIVKIPYLGNCLSVTCHTNEKGKGTVIYMASITDEQEQKLDNKKGIVIEVGKFKWSIGAGMVVAYGSIDFDRSSDDMFTLSNLNLVEPKGLYRGEYVPSYIDIENCEQSTTSVETFRFEELCKYKYCQLGKPSKCVIFKVVRR